MLLCVACESRGKVGMVEEERWEEGGNIAWKGDRCGERNLSKEGKVFKEEKGRGLKERKGRGFLERKGEVVQGEKTVLRDESESFFFSVYFFSWR